MRPAVTSTRHAVALIGLLGCLLCLPMLIANSGLLDRRDVYLFVNRNAGPFPWIYEQIFLKTNDVDIAFLGSSRMLTDISPKTVKLELSRKLGRNAEVFTAGWNWGGYDALYTVSRDLLEHRRVRMLVVYDDMGTFSHPFADYWLRFGEQSDARAGLSPAERMSCYANEVLGAPRYLLKLIRPVQFDPHWDTSPYYLEKDGANFREQLGAGRKRLGLGADPDTFVSFRPTGLATLRPAAIYSQDFHGEFQFTESGSVDYQIYFARKLAELCRQHGTRLVGIYLPTLADRSQTMMTWRAPWKELASGPAALIGIPPATLFRGIPEADVQKLFYNNDHMNQNGQDFFTPLITPALLSVYASSTNSI
jgi:hypothetical protein